MHQKRRLTVKTLLIALTVFLIAMTATAWATTSDTLKSDTTLTALTHTGDQVLSAEDCTSCHESRMAVLFKDDTGQTQIGVIGDEETIIAAADAESAAGQPQDVVAACQAETMTAEGALNPV